MSNPCNDSILPFLKLAASTEVEPASKSASSHFTDFLQKFELKTRLKYYEKVALLGDSKASAKRFALLINDSLESGLLSESHAVELIKRTENDNIISLFKGRGNLLSGFKVKQSTEQRHAFDQIVKLFHVDKLPHRTRVLAIRMIKESKIESDEADIILKNMKGIVLDENKATIFTSFIHYTRSLTWRSRMNALKHIDDIFKETSDSKSVQKFINFKKKADTYEANELLKITKKLLDSPESSSNASIERKAHQLAKEKRISFEKLSFGCGSFKLTPEHRMAASRFKNFAIVLGLGSTMTSYSLNNYDKPIDTNWASKLAFDIASTYFVVWVNIVIQTNPASTYTKKIIQSYLFKSGTDVPVTLAYSLLYNVSEKQAQARLNEVKADPDFENKVRELIAYFEENGLDKKFISEFEKIKNDDDLTTSDLEDEKIKDMFLEGLTERAYNEEESGLIKTGDKGADRYVFHRLYNIVAAPKSVLVDLLIYRTLCLGNSNPARAYALAVMIETANKVLFDNAYYFSRRQTINQ
jgi:hypothetical protein